MTTNQDYVHVEEVTTSRIVVAVYHDPARSYSRSVIPRAKREATRILRGVGGRWATTDIDFDRPLHVGNAVTVVTFERQP